MSFILFYPTLLYFVLNLRTSAYKSVFSEYTHGFKVVSVNSITGFLRHSLEDHRTRSARL